MHILKFREIFDVMFLSLLKYFTQYCNGTLGTVMMTVLLNKNLYICI